MIHLTQHPVIKGSQFLIGDGGYYARDANYLSASVHVDRAGLAEVAPQLAHVPDERLFVRARIGDSIGRVTYSGGPNYSSMILVGTTKDIETAVKHGIDVLIGDAAAPHTAWSFQGALEGITEGDPAGAYPQPAPER